MIRRLLHLGMIILVVQIVFTTKVLANCFFVQYAEVPRGYTELRNIATLELTQQLRTLGISATNPIESRIQNASMQDLANYGFQYYVQIYIEEFKRGREEIGHKETWTSKSALKIIEIKSGLSISSVGDEWIEDIGFVEVPSSKAEKVRLMITELLKEVRIDLRSDQDVCWSPSIGYDRLDQDQDGVLDALDECQNLPETFNGYQDRDGCPEPGIMLLELTVRNNQGTKIPATVWLYESETKIQNDHGEFLIPFIGTGMHSFIVRSEEYNSQEVSVRLPQDSPLRIYLEPLEAK